MARIVVGVDGSPGSLAALAWAVDEARTRTAVVEAVHAWHVPYVDTSAFVALSSDVDAMEAEAHAVLARAVAEVAHDGVVVDEVVRCASPASVLVEEAKDADLLVVGTRGHGGFAGLLIGSVSQQVTHHAPCPVVVVPTAPV